VTQAPKRNRIDAPRLVAYDVLRAVSSDDAYANLVLPTLLRERELDGRDAAFATELTYGTLRWQGLYDEILSTLVSRSLDDLDPGILEILRMGTHQILSMRVPEHAAVSSSVDLARTVMTAGPSAMVNAVLRKVTAHDLEQWAHEVLIGVDDPLTQRCIRWSHPRWIVSAFYDSLGGDLVALDALLAQDNVPAPVTLVARPTRSTPDDLKELGAEPGRWSPLAAVMGSGDPGDFEAVRRGDVGVQDEGSQLVTLALTSVAVESAQPEQWLDLCAGPGGKAALLAGLADERGAHVVANELHEHRAQLIRQVLRNGIGDHTVVVGDGTAGEWESASFDRVLVDAPCSGLGALRRRPEARWRRSAQDVAGLTKLQRQLLTSALDAVRPGGVVAYVTCSPHLAETMLVVTDVVKRRDDVTVLDAREQLPMVDQLGPGPYVQLWPHIHGTDAMFLALIRRNAQ
jgi:16S rRNA (cytosine967-C5)-methyltransferase